MKRRLDILILSDGRPGHFNLSEGIAAAIEKQTAATTRRIEVRRGRWPGHVLAALTRAPLPANAMLRAVYGIREGDLPHADVVVSAGAETLAANAWLARARGVPNIFYGSLRLFNPFDFNLILTSYARNASRPRHAMALKPSRQDPDALRTPRPLNSPDLTVGLLLGGNAGGITYTTHDWQRLTGMVVAALETTSWQWRIANSRRTPPEASQAISELSSRAADRITFLDVEKAGPGTLAGLIEASDALICTADSSSMLSECVWSRRPTIGLEPPRCNLTADEQSYRDWLAQQKTCTTLPIAGLSPETVARAFAQTTPLALNPQVALGQLIGKHIPNLIDDPQNTNAPQSGA